MEYIHIWTGLRGITLQNVICIRAHVEYFIESKQHTSRVKGIMGSLHRFSVEYSLVYNICGTDTCLCSDRCYISYSVEWITNTMYNWCKWPLTLWRRSPVGVLKVFTNNLLCHLSRAYCMRLFPYVARNGN